jgi:hypothetical protein
MALQYFISFFWTSSCLSLQRTQFFWPSFNFPTPPPFHNEGKRELNSLQLHSLHIDCWDTSLSKSKLLRANNITQSISSPKDGKVYLACNLPPTSFHSLLHSQSSCRDNALHKLLMHFLIWYSTDSFFLNQTIIASVQQVSSSLSSLGIYTSCHFKVFMQWRETKSKTIST